jgi:2-dehydropantoate 2-reductase
MLGPDTTVVTLQNGVDAPQQAAKALGKERVLPGLVKIFAYISAPGCIEHIGGPASLAFGEWNNEPSQRVERLRAALTEAGVAIDAPRDIIAALWMKFLIVSSFGGLGAISRAPLGVLRSMPETRSLIEQCIEEIVTLAHACGVALPQDIVSTTLAFIDGQPAAGTSSLQRDIAAGRPSELEAWNGAVVRLAGEFNTPVPFNSIVYHSLLPLERRARGLVTFGTDA